MPDRRSGRKGSPVLRIGFRQLALGVAVTVAAHGLFLTSLVAQAVPTSKQLEIAAPREAPWPSLRYHYLSPAAVDLGASGVATAWMTHFTTTDPRDYDRALDGIQGTTVAGNGRPLVPFLASTEVSSPGGVEPATMARIGNDRFVVVWSQSRDLGADISFRRFDATGAPLDAESPILGDIPDFRRDESPAVASSGAGFVIAWVRNVRPSQSGPSTWSPMVQVFDAAGEPLGAEIEVAAPTPGESSSRPAVAVEAGGAFIVLWQGLPTAPAQAHVVTGQRFAADGTPQGEPFRLADSGLGEIAMLAMPIGGFALTWSAPVVPAGGVRSLLLRRFDGNGTAMGPAVEIYRSGTVYEPALARDPAGNLALLWIEGRKPALALFNHDLVRQGPVLFDPPATPSSGCPARGAVTMSSDGRIFTVWIGPRAAKAEPSVLGRRWQARREDDLCLFRDHRFLCDTGNDGGIAELKLDFGQPGDVPFVGDASGRGEEDPCVFRAPRFRCDLGRDGVGVELPLTVPAGAQPLLGDVNGDGEVDPCYRQGERWTCKVWTISPVDTISWTFGTAHDLGLLGDVDGDGADDACVFRGGRFVCRVESAGEITKRTFDFRAGLSALGGGMPLLGDLDGDRRAEACLFRDGRLLCGVFPVAGGKPVRFLELRFGKAGDLPALGNVDGF